MVHYDVTDSTGREVFVRFRSRKQALIHLEKTKLELHGKVYDKRRVIKCHYSVKLCQELRGRNER